MANLTLGFGAVLVAMGLAGYFASGRASVTALIPAFIGALLLVAGAVARKEEWRKHGIHAALVIALLALLGTAPGVIKLLQWGLGTVPQRPMAVVAQAITAALSVGYLVLGIRSFRAARLAREAKS